MKIMETPQEIPCITVTGQDSKQHDALFLPSPYGSSPASSPGSAHSNTTHRFHPPPVHGDASAAASLLRNIGSPATVLSSLSSALHSPTGIPSPPESTGSPQGRFGGATVGVPLNFSGDVSTALEPVAECMSETSPTPSTDVLPVSQGRENHSESMDFGSLHMLLMAMGPELQSVRPATRTTAVHCKQLPGGDFNEQALVQPPIQTVMDHQPLQRLIDRRQTPEAVMSTSWNHFSPQASGYPDMHSRIQTPVACQHFAGVDVSGAREPEAQLSAAARQPLIHGDDGHHMTDNVCPPLKIPGLLERRRHSYAGAPSRMSLGPPNGPAPSRVPAGSKLRVSSVQLQPYDLHSQCPSAIVFPTPPPSAGGRKRSIDERETQLFLYDQASPPPDSLPDFRKRSRSFDLNAVFSMPTNSSPFDVNSYQDLQSYIANGPMDTFPRGSGWGEPRSFGQSSTSLHLGGSNFDALQTYSVPVINSGLHHPPPALSGENIPSLPSFEISPQDRGNPHAVPRRQRIRYPGDMYTPQWVRYVGAAKEGFCDTCDPGKWLQLKNSAYWYHKQFHHGISSVSGNTFVEPVRMRTLENGVMEGLCHQCGQWMIMSSAKRKNLVMWFRHAHKCHVYSKAKSGAVMPF